MKEIDPKRERFIENLGKLVVTETNGQEENYQRAIASDLMIQSLIVLYNNSSLEIEDFRIKCMKLFSEVLYPVASDLFKMQEEQK